MSDVPHPTTPGGRLPLRPRTRFPDVASAFTDRRVWPVFVLLGLVAALGAAWEAPTWVMTWLSSIGVGVLLLVVARALRDRTARLIAVGVLGGDPLPSLDHAATPLPDRRSLVRLRVRALPTLVGATVVAAAGTTFVVRPGLAPGTDGPPGWVIRILGLGIVLASAALARSVVRVRRGARAAFSEIASGRAPRAAARVVGELPGSPVLDVDSIPPRRIVLKPDGFAVRHLAQGDAVVLDGTLTRGATIAVTGRGGVTWARVESSRTTGTTGGGGGGGA